VMGELSTPAGVGSMAFANAGARRSPRDCDAAGRARAGASRRAGCPARVMLRALACRAADGRIAAAALAWAAAGTVRGVALRRAMADGAATPAGRAVLDDDSRRWLTALNATGAMREDAVRRLHELLLRAARFEEIGRASCRERV
jgi:hypothetical protein